MRRALSVLLLIVMSFPLLAGGFVSAQDVPACCRRDGRHHCASMTADAESNGPAVAAVQTKCPCYPKAASTGASRLTSVACTKSIELAPQAESAGLGDCRFAFSPSFAIDSEQKRGPPSRFN